MQLQSPGGVVFPHSALTSHAPPLPLSPFRSRNPGLQGTRDDMAPLTETPNDRFQHHVGFDNVPSGEATKNNTLSLTLNVKHKGYQARRRSRIFMVGIDEHSYSDYAIQWLLDELVDDGDEIVCVRVIEKDIRYNDKQYQEDANQVMDGILAKNGANRAISFVLEYAVGKLHATFQKLACLPWPSLRNDADNARQIQMYQPAMLIVGTRGRSLGGLQGLVNARNSFSKYCLQYSPVPVVVVRPTEKRIKKKVKRANDSTRQTYLGMLQATHGRHEADSETSSTYELEIQNSPDEEAHQVAQVLGLPAKFDPTIKPIQPSLLRPRSRPTSPHPGVEAPEGARVVDASRAGVGGDSDEEEDEEDAEFEVMRGRGALDHRHKLEQLHKMEVGEAAALKMGVDEDDTDESDDKPDGARDPKSAS
ncbi:Universal stress protein A family protein C25B2.10 [Tolypocladium paradoxum]|uniref:Universal stress protein A family protein C25B2.10 n=1 Tax=Tolypocladium paradoxum TaxID=94208 RepID=A0A2S4KXK1_9HYPO|nr:Universal stress protein A family protein C25B2.10 [Tolypocladium paradoxum]